jgi:hypothetical protein
MTSQKTVTKARASHNTMANSELPVHNSDMTISVHTISMHKNNFIPLNAYFRNVNDAFCRDSLYIAAHKELLK